MMFPGLIVRSSSIHAAGCCTMRPIRKGVRVCEYDGLRLSKAVADARYLGRPVTYLFFCGRNTVIDGFGMAMFLNHSCDPNCETEQDANGRIFIRTLRPVAAGEELTYEYNLCDSGDEDAHCFCAAPNCRATLFSPLELKRRARAGRRNPASTPGPARAR
jgi:SET domain-containing protein